ncbi:MAG TPA: HIT family protein [Candidatus Omnitrophota bacterium]|nr:HIT family protein [Candidatus Omnitrophota bacterium]
MPTIFTKIISGEIPCHKIAEDQKHLAFLDIRPIHDGHTLVIPKKEISYIFSMEDQELADLMVFAKKVAQKIQAKVPCKRIGVMVCGLEVPHTHIHLVPFEAVRDLNFANAKEASQESLAAVAAKIRGDV